MQQQAQDLDVMRDFRNAGEDDTFNMSGIYEPGEEKRSDAIGSGSGIAETPQGSRRGGPVEDSEKARRRGRHSPQKAPKAAVILDHDQMDKLYGPMADKIKKQVSKRHEERLQRKKQQQTGAGRPKQGTALDQRARGGLDLDGQADSDAEDSERARKQERTLRKGA